MIILRPIKTMLNDLNFTLCEFIVSNLYAYVLPEFKEKSDIDLIFIRGIN